MSTPVTQCPDSERVTWRCLRVKPSCRGTRDVAEALAVPQPKRRLRATNRAPVPCHANQTVSASSPAMVGALGVAPRAPRRRRWRDRILRRGGRGSQHARRALRDAAPIDLHVKYLGLAAATRINASTDTESGRHSRATAVRKTRREVRRRCERADGAMRGAGMLQSSAFGASDTCDVERLALVVVALARHSKTRHRFRRTTPRCITREGSIKPLRSAPR